MIEINEPGQVTAFCRNCGKIFHKPNWSKKTCCSKRCEAIWHRQKRQKADAAYAAAEEEQPVELPPGHVWKRLDSDRWECPFQPDNVSCEHRRCAICGWNPNVARSRTQKILGSEAAPPKPDPEAVIRAYQNGKNFMREEILKMLYVLKQSQLGVARGTVSDVIEMIERLDVRP